MGSEWKKIQLGDLISITHGYAFKGDDFSDANFEGPIVVTIGNFDYTGGFRFESTKIKRCNNEYPAEYELLPGDILLVMTCQTEGGEILGIPGIIPDDNETYLHNQRLGKIIIKSSEVSSKYLYWLFLSRDFNLHLCVTATGTKILHTAPKRIESFVFYCPPLPEQKAIAHILGSLDDKIELNRRMNATLEGMAQALFKSWFVDFDPVIDNALFAGNPIPDELVERAEVRSKALADGTANREAARQFPAAFQLTEEMGWIPAGWVIKKADEIAKITIGKTPPRKESHWFSDISSGNIVWVSIKDMGSCGSFIGDSNEYLTPESVDRFNIHVIPEGSVILSFKLTIGRVSITQKAMATNEAIAHFVNPKFDLTKEFLYCYLKGFDFSCLGNTSSIATAVNSKIIKAIPFLVPNSMLLKVFKKTTQSWASFICPSK